MAFTAAAKNWRFYADDAAEPVTALANQNVTLTMTERRQVVRLRLGIKETTGASGSGAVSLRVATSPSGPWADVGEGSAFDYADGLGTAGAALARLKLTGTTVAGYYHETSATAEAWDATQPVVEMDFALVVDQASAATTYYFAPVVGATQVTAFDVDITVTTASWSANPITSTIIKRQMLVTTSDTSQDALISTLADSVLATMEARLGRTLTSAAYTDVYDGNGRRTLYLRHDPVTAVSSITRDGAAVEFGMTAVWPPATAVLTDGMALTLTDDTVWTLGVANVIVSYTAGWVTPPDDLVTAGALWVVQLFRTGRRFPVSAESRGSLSDQGGEMPGYVSYAIDTWKRDALW